MLTHFSLFTGIGGIDLAAEWAGFKTVGQCEWADYPTKVLEKHWPDIARWRDVRSVTIEDVRNRGIEEITLLSGGFPCQPHSTAGERQASNDERDMWPENRRIIGELRPKWYLGENVAGLLSSEDGRFFGGVLRDLAELGYSVGWGCFPAYAVGAFHERERVFILANSECSRLQVGIQKFGYSGKANEKSSNTLAYDCLSGRIYKQRIWPTEAGICGMADGVPNWMDRLKCLGNAVVPQQVYPILQAIADIERNCHDR
jgi:DNA (cytosine-5)-methyltransferase 1